MTHFPMRFFVSESHRAGGFAGAEGIGGAPRLVENRARQTLQILRGSGDKGRGRKSRMVEYILSPYLEYEKLEGRSGNCAEESGDGESVMIRIMQLHESDSDPGPANAAASPN